MRNDFTDSERNYLDDLVARRTSDFPRPPWMQPSRARAVKAEARRLIGELPPPPPPPPGPEYYNATMRVRALGGRGKGYKIHEAGFDARPVCTMGQGTDWKGEDLGAGPVTCGKCAATRN